MQRNNYFAGLALAGILLAGGALFLSAQTEPKYTVQEVMKAGFKGNDAIAAKALKGKATKEELDKLVEYVTSLPLNEPPQGDAEGWKKQTSELLNAVKALDAGKDGALDQFTKAANCKACHNIYRPE